MRQGGLRYERALLVLLLTASVFAPVFFFAAKFSSFAEESGFVDGISATTRHSGSESLHVKSAEKREIFEYDRVAAPNITILSGVVGGVAAPNSTILSGVVGGVPVSGGEGARTSDDAGVMLVGNASFVAETVDDGNQQPALATDDRHKGLLIDDNEIQEMKDQLTMAKAYLQFAPPNSNSHFVRELRLRMKEVERVISRINKDSDLPSALQKKKAMEVSLSKAEKLYPDCSAMATKLRSMTHNTEEQLRAHKNQASYLMQLAARTFPKGLHCLSMSLTAEYFALHPAERELPNKSKTTRSNLHHYVIFSDNVLACAVVVNSTVKASMQLGKIVIHVVTDALNYPAMTMWFLRNPLGEATISIENLDSFKWYNSSYSSLAAESSMKDLRFDSELNYARFYLPQIFPYLDKVLLLDHDVVVQKDLRKLWGVKTKGKVIGAVEMCRPHVSDLRLEKLANFSDPVLSTNFERRTCAWAFGVNIFDLREWRRKGLTSVYHKWLQLSKKKHILKAGSLPLGQLTFYNKSFYLDQHWHVHGLGLDSNIGRSEIERAAVIHFDGIMKPWLEIGLAKYKGYWTKFLNYDHPYLQQCNIHP